VQELQAGGLPPPIFTLISVGAYSIFSDKPVAGPPIAATRVDVYTSIAIVDVVTCLSHTCFAVISLDGLRTYSN